MPTNLLLLHNPLFWALVLILVLVLLVYLLRKKIEYYWNTLCLEIAIRRLGGRRMKKVVLADGMDGLVHIDYLICTSQGFLVVAIKQYEGLIYGGVHNSEWSQVKNGKNYPFANPLQELQVSMMTLKAFAHEIPIKPIVVFSGNSIFPQKKPDGIITLNELRSLPRDKGKVSEAILECWQKIQKAAE